MAEAQASPVSSLAVYRRPFPARPARNRRSTRGAVADALENAREDGSRGTEEPKAADGSDRRRAYNREYMRQWRKRNQERYRVYNREYQRKRHMERKIARILNAPEEKRNLCGYGCGREAVKTVERIDPRTWKTVQMPYCGHC